jgi:hypothetical protein
MGRVRVSLALLVLAAAAHANSIILGSVDAPLGEQQTLWINENGTNTQLYWAGGSMPRSTENTTGSCGACSYS